MLIFRVIILCFLEIFKAREFGILVQGVFFFGGGGGGGKRGFVRSPRDYFFGGGLIFVPIRSSPSLEIFISWKTF